MEKTGGNEEVGLVDDLSLFGSATFESAFQLFSPDLLGVPSGLPVSSDRVEKKVLIPYHYLGKLLTETRKHLPPSRVGNTKSFTEVETIYYDSARLDFFKNHFSSLPIRYKMRLRRYVPDGDPLMASGNYLEVKKKEKGITHKFRIQVSNENVKSLNAHSPLHLSPALQAMNAGLSRAELESTVGIINTLIMEFRPCPILSSSYRRVAFENQEVRLTFDTEIDHQPILLNLPSILQEIETPEMHEKGKSLLKKYSRTECFVMEIKYPDSSVFPEWISQIFCELNLKPTSFSKYCWNTLAIFAAARRSQEKVS